MKLTLAVDEDMLVYHIAYYIKDKDSKHEVRHQVWKSLIRLLDLSGHAQLVLCRSDKPLWRTEMYPEYKAKRKHDYNPWRSYVKAYLAEYCTTVKGEEADDIMASLAIQENYIICTNDKDLKQIPGRHLSFQGERNLIDEETANYNFCTQLLMGDSIDNIPGIPGMGIKRAKVALENMPNTVGDCLNFYLKKGFSIDYFSLMYKLMKMKTDLKVEPKIITIEEIRALEESYG
jgi:5'-3' exonuclease